MFSLSSTAQLSIGDKAPSFNLPDENGNMVSSDDIYGKEMVVVYFYPKDDTPGCTKEACSFRDHFEEFTDAGVRVIGVSSDDQKSHAKFANKYNLPYTLLSDTDKIMRNDFGVKGDLFGLIPGRVSFLIDQNGVVQNIVESQTNPERHIVENLAMIEKLRAN